MKRMMVSLSIFTVTLWMVLSPCFTLSQEKSTAWEVYFSPHEGCTEAIVRELNKAKSTVLVQAYLFSSGPIGKALLDAHKKGIKVRVILDKSQKTENYSGQPGNGCLPRGKRLST